MNKLSASLIGKTAIAIVIAVGLLAPSAYASCNTQMCPGGGYPCLALFQDFSLSGGCSAWKAVNGASITTSGGGYALLTPTTGALYQDIVVPAEGFNTTSLSIWLGGVTGTPGTEFYRLLISTTSSSLLEYVDVFWPGDNPTGRYDYDITHYAGQTIRVRISRIQGTAPGNTVLRVDAIEAWVLDI